jgi:hypothetical protein
VFSVSSQGIVLEKRESTKQTKITKHTKSGPDRHFGHQFCGGGCQPPPHLSLHFTRNATTSVRSLVFIPGKGAEFMALRHVPHGAIRQVLYRSSALSLDRRMHIYTPPGYDLAKTSYPVLYLLHGGGAI